MDIGIVGLGYWGKKVYREYLSLVDEGMINGIHLYDTQINALSDQIYRNTSVVIHDDYQSLIDQVDAVHICVPNDFHYEYTSRSLEAGVGALVEKPLTKNSTEAFNLVEMALDKGLVLQVGNIFRFANSVKIAKEIISKGQIGTIHHINISWTHLAPSVNSKKEDVLWDLGPHIFDILNFLTGLWPISAIYNPYKGRNAGDKMSEANLIMDYGDFTTSIRISLIDHRRMRLVQISGSGGTIVMDPVIQDIAIHSDTGIKHINAERNNTIRDEIMNFIECTKDGKTKVNSGNLGTAIVRELENIYGVHKNEALSGIQ